MTLTNLESRDVMA